MSLKGKLNIEAIKHMNQASDTAKAHEKFYKKKAEKLKKRRRSTTKVNVPFPPQVAAAQAINLGRNGEPQVCMIRNEDGSLRLVCGTALEKFLLNERASRPYKLHIKDYRLRKRDGVKVPRYRRVYGEEPLTRITITTTQYQTEFLKLFAKQENVDALMRMVAGGVERTTGMRALVVGGHTKTDNFHVDTALADRGIDGHKYEGVKTGCFGLGEGKLIMLRYHEDGIPVDPVALEEVDSAIKFDAGKEGFTCHPELVVGKEVDKWFHNLAASLGKKAEYATLRARYIEHAQRIVTEEAESNDLHAKCNPVELIKKQQAEIAAAKSELANSKGNTAELEKLKKRLEATEVCLSAQMQQAEVIKQEKADLLDEKKRLMASLNAHKMNAAKALEAQSKAEKELAAAKAAHSTNNEHATKIAALEKRVSELSLEAAAMRKEACDIWEAGRAYELKWREEEEKRIALENRYEPRAVIEKPVVEDIVVEKKPVAPAPAPSLRRSVDPTTLKFGGVVTQSRPLGR